MNTRITHAATCVLQAIADGYAFGFDIMDYTGLPSGTAYPILRRFEEHGLVESEWEDDGDALADGRPRRRYYALTVAGHAALSEARQRFERSGHLFTDAAGPRRAES